MPRLTPAQRQFGLGMSSIEKQFRPPEDMEDDPAYNDFARNRWAAQDAYEAQKGQVQLAIDQQQMARENNAIERQTRDEENAAIEALRGKNPDEFPNVLAQFPGLARSKNISGIQHYAQAVTPSAGQKTLAPSLRMRLKPEERQYFDEHYNENGDAIAAHDYAQMKSGHEQFLGELAPHVIAGGGGLEDIQKLRGMQNLGPLERSLLTEQWKGKAPKEDATQKAILEGIYKDIDEGYEPPVGPDGKPVSMSPLDIAIAKAKLKQQAKAAVFQPPAQAQQAVNPAANIPQAGSQLKEVLRGGSPTASPEEIKKELDSYVGSKDADENFYSNYIANPQIPVKDKQVALDKFRDFVANPPLPPGTTLGEAMQRKERLKRSLVKAEEDLALHPVREEFSRAWQEEKQSVDRDINDFAKSFGVSKEQVLNSLVKGEELDMPGGIPDDLGRLPKISVRDLLWQYVAEKEGNKGESVFGRAAPRLHPFASHPKAKQLGVDSILGSTLSSAIGLQGAGVPTRNDVLDAYLKENAVAKIKSVTEVK